jgi:hypothetical protein
MLHSGVFVGRQYAAFAGITHGQKVHDLIERLLMRRFVTAIDLGSTGRTRIFHVHHKPLYAAIPRSLATHWSVGERVSSAWTASPTQAEWPWRNNGGGGKSGMNVTLPFDAHSTILRMAECLLRAFSEDKWLAMSEPCGSPKASRQVSRMVETAGVVSDAVAG